MGRLQDFPSVTPTSSDNILIVQSQGQGLASVGSTLGAKMDKASPIGTGTLSLNRASGSTVGSYSSTIGYNNTASGNYSIAVGRECTASGNSAYAEGYQTKAQGNYSHAEGFSCTASGQRSHSEGDYAQATGDTSHAEGTATIANHKAQHVFGQYNTEDPSSALATERGNYVEIVGKGVSNTNRSNARTLDWNGNEILAGGLKVNGSDDVQPMVALANLSSNTTTTYTIPSSIFDDYGIYILAFGSNYGVGAVYILMVAGSSGGDKIKIIPLVTSTYLSISAVAKNQVSVTSGGANFHPHITRIA